MANTKSTKKRTKTNEIRRMRNVACRSDFRTAAKKVIDALDAQDMAKAKEFLCVAQSKFARAQVKGVMKKNTTARKISRLAKKVSAVAQGESK